MLAGMTSFAASRAEVALCQNGNIRMKQAHVQRDEHLLQMRGQLHTHTQLLLFYLLILQAFVGKQLPH